MPAMLMSDEEFNDACDQRELRNNLVCCICEKDGLDCEDCYANTEKQKIIVPSCNNVNHSLCIDCLKTIANLEVTKKNSTGHYFRRLPCQYPYLKTNCYGKIKKKHWKNVLSRQVLHRNNSFYEQLTHHNNYEINSAFYFTICSSCKKEQAVSKSLEVDWTCKECLRSSCGRCDQTNCHSFSECGNKLQWELKAGFSRHFTFQLTNGEIIPLRRNLITLEMINSKIYQARQNASSATVHCPTCKTKIYKTSACNDLKHCGNMHICNFCQEQSFPWEVLGLPFEHWSACSRWDCENSLFPCKENDCFNDKQECTNKVHAQKILQFNTQKYLAFESSIIQDTKSIIN